MTEFQARISFKGANGKVVHRYHDLGDFNVGTEGGNYEAAESALSQIRGAYDAITDATIIESTLTSVASTSNAAGAGDVFEVLNLSVFLDSAGEKTTMLYPPAPTQGVFLATEGINRDVADTSNADLVQWVQQVSQHSFVSDGEQVDTTVNNGMDKGVRGVKNLKLGK